jgi:ArsR family transcriptional regulator
VKQQEWAAKIFKALGHPIRYKIAKFLADGPHCVCELNQDVEFSQSNLSQHLRILREAGLVSSEKDGLRIFYRLTDSSIGELINRVEALSRLILTQISASISLDEEDVS